MKSPHKMMCTRSRRSRFATARASRPHDEVSRTWRISARCRSTSPMADYHRERRPTAWRGRSRMAYLGSISLDLAIAGLLPRAPADRMARSVAHGVSRLDLGRPRRWRLANARAGRPCGEVCRARRIWARSGALRLALARHHRVHFDITYATDSASPRECIHVTCASPSAQATRGGTASTTLIAAASASDIFTYAHAVCLTRAGVALHAARGRRP